MVKVEHEIELTLYVEDSSESLEYKVKLPVQVTKVDKLVDTEVTLTEVAPAAEPTLRHRK